MTFIVLLAILIDALVGEPKKYHPLVGFGNGAIWLEKKLWQDKKANGILALAIVLLLTTIIALMLSVLSMLDSSLYYLLNSVMLYLVIAPRSLVEHAKQVYDALADNNLEGARYALSMVVSRDTQALEEGEIASACCESVLENGNDGIFAAIFWFCLTGFYGALIYRVVNTLDAMWGYKNKRYHQFGWATAKLDDVLNYIPARLVAMSYSLMGDFKQGIHCWLQQGQSWKSPNAGPVMAAGAGSLNILLGGAANYSGKTESRPALGCGHKAVAEDINRALTLIKSTLLFWLLIIFIIDMLL